MKKNIFSVLVMLLALCCLFVGCENPAAPNSGNDGKDDINGGNEEVVKDWWLGTWYADIEGEVEIEGQLVTNIREIYEINSDETWVYYAMTGNKYIIIDEVKRGETESGGYVDYIYSFSNEQQPINCGDYLLRKFEPESAIREHDDGTQSIFYGKFEDINLKYDNGYDLRLYLDDENQCLVEYIYTSKNDNILFTKLK